MGVTAAIAEARRVVGDGPTYISFDVDGLDPVYAPGTGTPEVGGLTTIEAQRLIRGLRGLHLVGGDVVEVAPPFDPSQIGAIERAIQAAKLGLNPSNDGALVRIPIPPLTDDRRKELSRLVHKMAEEGRTSVRQVRRDVNDGLKKLLKSHELGEDDERRALESVQKLTDDHVTRIDALQKTKDDELLQR